MYEKNDSLLANPVDVFCSSTSQDLTLASETTFLVFDKIFHGVGPVAHEEATTQTLIGDLILS